jgi:hypothetical protein
MTAWRNVIFSGLIGACLIAGCTVTTSSSNSDGGLFADDTGGTSSVGGSSGNTGGSTSTGGTTGTGTTVTVVECVANYAAPATPRCGDNELTTSCDSCLQTNNCTESYKACYLDENCMPYVSAMMNCMAKAFDDSSTGMLPETADSDCQASTGLSSTSASASATRAAALWTEIQVSLYCSEVCCYDITS